MGQDKEKAKQDTVEMAAGNTYIVHELTYKLQISKQLTYLGIA